MIEKPVLTSITEGKTTLFVYTKNQYSTKGPGQKQGLPFYNPAMSMNRDISTLVLQYLIDQKKKSCTVLDGMAASGIRGFRFLNEVQGDAHITINDIADASFYLIKKNARKLDTSHLTLSQENIHTLLSKHSYDYIDIDPFGSPAIFVDSALRSITNNGIIAVTATDTATLCGVYPRVCKRRYNAVPLHGACMHETALRILLGFIGNQAGKYDTGIVPLLSYSTDHYFRCYLEIKKGVKQANQTIDQIHQIVSTQIPGQIGKEIPIGPIWRGFLQKKEAMMTCCQLGQQKQLQNEKEVLLLLNLLEQEALMPPFYYSTNTLSKFFKKSPPRLDDLLLALSNQGYHVTKTHFDSTGFKTTAPQDIVDRIFQHLSL